VPWIYNEDGALKLKLQGLTVSDPNNSSRPVPVRYRLPEDELATLTYPCIVIEHQGINPAPEREHRGYIKLQYAPEGLPIWWPPYATSYDPTLSPYYCYYPLPYNMDYSVTIYCRKMAEHLQPLIATLATENYLPYHFGYLDIPQDGTVRNMFLMQGPQIEYGKDKDDKRLFRATYMIRVMTEIIPTIFNANIDGQPVTEIALDLGVYQDVSNLNSEELAANQALISTGLNLSWNVGLTAPSGPSGTTQPRETIPNPRRKPARAIVR
jgi:hypothetical protein